MLSAKIKATTEALQQLEALQKEINQAVELLKTTVKKGNKILICGNGGSAADSQHFAAELMVKYKKLRPPIPCIALTTDTSLLTAHTNDFGFDTIFARQVWAHGQKGDLLIAISTSGNSKNIHLACLEAIKLKLNLLILTGRDGGLLKQFKNRLVVGSIDSETCTIQEVHIFLLHYLCEALE